MEVFYEREKNKTPGTAKDNNALYILIFTVVVVIGIAVFIFSKNNSSKNDTNNAGAVANNNAGTTALSVVETNGSLERRNWRRRNKLIIM